MSEQVYRFFDLSDLPIQFREEVTSAIKSGVVKAVFEEKSKSYRITGQELERYLGNRTHDIKFTM